MEKLPIETPNPAFGLYLYPTAKDIMEKQQDIGWFAQEIKVEKDIQDYRVTMAREAYELTTLTLHGFVEIEETVGDIWTEIGEWFPHSEIRGCCSVISSMEKSVHAFFYQKMSDVLNIDPIEALEARQEIGSIKRKLVLLADIMKHASDNKPLTLAALAMIEQVLLFSNFAMLKSFQANGNNLIVNTISGVDYVINDEVLHGTFAAYLFNAYVTEAKTQGGFDELALHQQIVDLTTEIIEHEDDIIDLTFKEGVVINGVTGGQLKSFIRSRANFVADSLGLTAQWSVNDSIIADWFYRGANSIKMHDFFVKGTNSYSRTWSESAFTRLPHIGKHND